MPRRAPPIYQRGPYWLEWDRRADGQLRSPYLTIFWYEPATRRIKSASTRTVVEADAIRALDLRYLADGSQAPAFCPACGRPMATAKGYLLSDAMADYRLEKGDNLASAVSVRARLNSIADFLEATGEVDMNCEDAGTESFATRYRAWAAEKPVEWRNGDGVVTASKVRTPAAIEECLTQMKAALNYAVDKRRSDSRPVFKSLGRKKVSPPVTTRCDEAVITDMLTYARDSTRRAALHAFIVGSILTLGRPDAIVDISTDPERQQWRPGSTVLHLNQKGRIQTKKWRAIVPVMPMLNVWLSETLADPKSGGWLVNYYGEQVQDVDSAWASMLRKLKLPTGRDWKSYLLRRSMATMLRDRGVDPWELAGFMGHQVIGTTEIYAIGRLFPTVQAALADILGAIESRSPGALHRKRSEEAAPVVPITAAVGA